MRDRELPLTQCYFMLALFDATCVRWYQTSEPFKAGVWNVLNHIKKTKACRVRLRTASVITYSNLASNVSFFLKLNFLQRMPPLINHSYIWDIFNTLRAGQNGRHFADDIIKCSSVNENVRILLTISLKYVPKVRINSIPFDSDNDLALTRG